MGLPDDGVGLTPEEEPEPMVSDSEATEEERGARAEETTPPEAPPTAQAGLPLKNVVEAILFVTPEPLPLRKLGEVAGGVPADELMAVIRALQKEYEGRGVELVQLAGGWRFFSREEYAPWAKKVLPVDAPPRLSRAALETLSIIAYRQPITRVTMEEIRGVNCDGVLRTLLERGFVSTSGREDVPGRPFRYRTTKHFLRYFGLASLAELPPLEETKAEG